MKVLKKYEEFTAPLLCLIFVLLGLGLGPVFPGWSQVGLILGLVIGGYESAREGWRDWIENRHLNVDVLMVLAAIGAGIIGYWLEAALLIFIFSAAEALEEIALRKNHQAIQSLMSLQPVTAWRLRADGQLEEVQVADLLIGDVLRVKQGQSIPIDGCLLSSQGSVNEALLTGEPLPVDKALGQSLLGGSVNVGDEIEMQVTVIADQTVFARILRLIEQAQNQKSRLSSLIERVEDIYVKIVLIMVPSFIAASHFLLGWPWSESIYRGMILLTVASPCALIASSTPAVLAAMSRAAKLGVIVKGGQIMDQIGSLEWVVMDKTGTVTLGSPQVKASWFREEDVRVRQVIAAIEDKSTHPLAQAIVDYLDTKTIVEGLSVTELSGYGLQASYQGQEWRVGKVDFVTEDMTEWPYELQEAIQSQLDEGMTLVLATRHQELVAWFSLNDPIKEESAQAVQSLRSQDVEVMMLTGDHAQAAERIAQQIGIEQVKASCLPDQKAYAIQDLQATGALVAMVGDGVNDAPALAQADVSFAIGSGTDIAMETADCVILDDLIRLPQVVALSRRLGRIVRQNIALSLGVIICLILANVLQVVNLPLGVIGHEGSTILVILNGLRLLAWNPSKEQS